MPQPTVSVLIPSYNHARFLDETISSIANQTFPEWELLICDDGSTDNSWDIITQWTDTDRRINAFRQENQGVCDTLNKLGARARGKYIITMGSDDALAPTRLEQGIEQLDLDPSLAVIFCGVDIVNENGDKIADSHCPFSNDLQGKALTKRLLEGNCVCATSAMIRSSALRQGEPLARKIYTVQDYDLWRRLLRNGNLLFQEHRLVRYRWHSENLSKSNIWLSMLEQRQVLEQHAAAIIDHHQLGDEAPLRVHNRLFSFSLGLGDHPYAARLLLKKQRIFGLSEQEVIWLLRFLVLSKQNQQAKSLLDAFVLQNKTRAKKTTDFLKEINLSLGHYQLPDLP